VLQWPPGDGGCYRVGRKDAICPGRPGGYDSLMPYALTLPLDDAAAAEVVRMWHALAEQAGDDGCIRLGYTPHITLAVLPDSAPLTEIEEAAFGAARQWAPLSLALAGIGIFPGAPPTPPGGLDRSDRNPAFACLPSPTLCVAGASSCSPVLSFRKLGAPRDTEQGGIVLHSPRCRSRHIGMERTNHDAP
jgi:hypothetical protein